MRFDTPDFLVRALRPDEVPMLQALFNANPSYFERVGGQAPLPDEAQREFDERPPAGLAYREHHFAGVFDHGGALQGVVIGVSDLCAAGVWHTALFLLATAWHGTGAAARLHQGLEAWAQADGATWLRLCVMIGNTRAERFWTRCGYTEVCTRDITNAAGQPRTVRVMVKPLASQPLADYGQLVPRDNPNPPAPQLT